jgi:hypothetical protein
MNPLSYKHGFRVVPLLSRKFDKPYENSTDIDKSIDYLIDL